MIEIKKIIITEKPSVAREFAKVLKVDGKNNNGYIESNEYIVTWCVGHLVTMSYPEKYDENLKYWNLRTLPFIPETFKYEVIENVKSQFDIVSSILSRDDIETIYVCTDSGREGEYIYRLVESLSNVKCKDKRRVWIDAQTEEAILNGIKDAKALSYYDALASSAYLRAKEDYLIGINFSRLLSIVYGKSLAQKLNEERASISIGRVMTCVLGMVCRREREIRNFKKVEYFKLQGNFDGVISDFKVTEKSKYFESLKLYNETGFKKEIDAKEAVSYIMDNKEKAIVSEVSKKKLKENAPLLFNLAEMQNECTKRYKISPDETLDIIQKLYERKLLTYPRTDARVLSTAAAKDISKNLNGLAKNCKIDIVKDVLDEMIKNKYKTDLLKTKYVNDTKVTDHFAIIPTGQGFENYNSLSDLEKSIYTMTVIRFLSIFFPPAEYNKVNISFDVNNETFTASSKVLAKEGYLFAVNKEKKSDKKENNEDNSILNNLKKGSKINLNEVNIKSAETSPPQRYSSGSMILAMENAGKLIEDEKLREQIKSAGIGTSATRGDIIKKLETIKYIESNKKTQILTPTKKGEYIFDIVRASMPDLLNPDLTASWEKGLNMVKDGEIKEEEFKNKLNKYIRDKVVKFKKELYF